MRKIISLIMVLFLTFGAIGCFVQLKKIDEGDNNSSVSSSGTSTSDEESRELTSESESETPQVKTLGSLEVGSKVKVSHSKMGDIEFLIVDKDHDGYPENSTTLITEKIILFRCVDAKEPNNSDVGRKNYGNNKYSVSNLDQWLNSAAAAGQWYSARHSVDQAPDSTNVFNNNEYDQDTGFLTGFDDAFVAALKDTTLKVALNIDIDGGGYESITRKFFLASGAEMFGREENSVMEGSILSYFSADTNAIRIAVASEYAAAHSEYAITAGTAYNCWLRTPVSSSSYDCYFVFSDGGYGSRAAYYGNYGVRPLCNLSSDTKVSETPDENGYYSLVFTEQESGESTSESEGTSSGYTVTIDGSGLYGNNKVRINGVETDIENSAGQVFSNVKTFNFFSYNSSSAISNGTGSIPNSYNWVIDWAWNEDIAITEDSSFSVANDL